jgi:UDPglucose--hexose-1-phosphate uridylyltransferase
VREFRRDPITGRWVIIASGRAHRPRQFGSVGEHTQAEPCPFCSGNEALTPPELWAARVSNSLPDTPGWLVRVVPNKYPALALGESAIVSDDPLYRSQPALGAHEVLIESASHDVSLSAVDENQLWQIVSAYRARLREHSRDPRWRYALLYKNQGDGAGATLEHVHSQLVAMPEAPQAADEELQRAKAHYQSARSCIYCTIIERETARRERVVFENTHFVALCPFAPRFAYETWLLPKAHLPAFVDSPDEVMHAFARALGEILRRLDVALANPPFNYFIHSMPLDGDTKGYYHWQLRILPQLARAAGFEWGSGAHINSITPEDAARILRNALE